MFVLTLLLPLTAASSTSGATTSGMFTTNDLVGPIQFCFTALVNIQAERYFGKVYVILTQPFYKEF